MSQTDIEASIEAEVESQSSQEAEIKEEKDFSFLLKNATEKCTEKLLLLPITINY